MTAQSPSRRGRSWIPFLWLPLLGIAVVLTVYFTLPTEHVGLVGIRLLFEGADRGRYPNGTPFSAEEIIARPVLRELFDTSELAKRGSFDAFASAFFVAQSSRDLELYIRCSGPGSRTPKLSPVDRSRIETEYRSRLESAGRAPELIVGLRQPFDADPLDGDAIQRLLDGTLQGWVKAAETTQGVLRYDIDVSGGRVVEGGGSAQREVIIRLDALRVRSSVNCRRLTACLSCRGSPAWCLRGTVSARMTSALKPSISSIYVCSRR